MDLVLKIDVSARIYPPFRQALWNNCERAHGSECHHGYLSQPFQPHEQLRTGATTKPDANAWRLMGTRRFLTPISRPEFVTFQEPRHYGDFRPEERHLSRIGAIRNPHTVMW